MTPDPYCALTDPIPYDDADGLTETYVKSMVVTKDGDLWVATDAAGVGYSKAYSAGGVDSAFVAVSGLRNETLTRVSMDQEGTIWFGTSPAGNCRQLEHRQLRVWSVARRSRPECRLLLQRPRLRQRRHQLEGHHRLRTGRTWGHLRRRRA